MHTLVVTQISEGIVLTENKSRIESLIAAHAAIDSVPEDERLEVRVAYNAWVDYIYTFEYRAMTLTYLLYCAWMFTFQHIYEAVFAAKNKRVAKFVLFENMLDFWVMVMGMIYITIVYKVYRFDTFLSRPDKEAEAEQFFRNWSESTANFDDQIFLLAIDATFLIKGLVQLRLLPVVGPAFAILMMLLKELLIFAVFFFLQ